MNKLQQIIFDVIEEMQAGDVYGSLPANSIQTGNQLYNQDSYAKGYQGIPFKGAIQKRTFPELITAKNTKLTNLKTTKKPKKKKNGKQKQK
jgi:hypothetical protein